MKGKLTISRANSNNIEYNNKIHITIEDENYHSLMDIWVSAEQFGLALTGLACRECEIENEGA